MQYPVGKYIIKEVFVNEYYILDNNTREIEITEDGQIVSVTFKNKSVPYEEPVPPTPPKLPKTGC